MDCIIGFLMMSMFKLGEGGFNFIILMFIFYVFSQPFFFFDKVSFLLLILIVIVSFFVFLMSSVIYLYYYKSNLVVFVFLLMMFILFLSFYYADIFLFYMFFEFSVIPIFVYILSWGGGSSKIFAGLYLFFFTFFSSLLFFLGLFFVWILFGSFYFMILFYEIFFLDFNFLSSFMLLVFFIKMPIYIFHIWLPLAHVESPMLGSMVLASVMLKLGGYGLLRMIFIFFWDYFFSKIYFFVWGLFGSMIMSFSCLFNIDLKSIVAYSSVSHMSMIFMSSFSLNYTGKWGFMSMMLSHGLISSLMFWGLGVIYYRLFSRNLYLLNGIIMLVPLFGMWWFLIGIMNLGFPPFISFFSEFFIFFSMVIFNESFLIMGLILIMFSSIYTINLMIYLISGLSKWNFGIMEIMLIEHLIFFVHFFFLFISPFFYWLI